MKRTKALESVAYHEAGHAVAAWHVRVRTTALSIVPDEDAKGFHAHRPYFGGINLEYDDSPRAQRRAENMALVCLVGPAAQRRFNPKGFRNYHVASDRHEAIYLLAYIGSEDEYLNAYLKLIEIQARNFVTIHYQWSLFECLAEALLERQRLTGKDVRRVIGECSRAALGPIPVIAVQAQS